MRNVFGQPLIALGLLSLATPAFADRGPSKEESQAIAAKLTAEGYQRWDKIELDDGVWEVDNARTLDGKVYDLKLNAAFQIVKKSGD